MRSTIRRAARRKTGSRRPRREQSNSARFDSFEMLLVRDSDLGNASPRQCRTLCRICCAATRRVSLNPNRGPSCSCYASGRLKPRLGSWLVRLALFPEEFNQRTTCLCSLVTLPPSGKLSLPWISDAQEDAGQYARPGNLEFGIRILCQHRLKKLPMPIVLSITRSRGSHSRMPVENVKLRVDGGPSRGGSGFLQEARQDQREKDAVEERRETSLIGGVRAITSLSPGSWISRDPNTGPSMRGEGERVRTVNKTAVRGPACSLPRNNQYVRPCGALHKRKYAEFRAGPAA